MHPVIILAVGACMAVLLIPAIVFAIAVRGVVAILRRFEG